MSTKSPKVMEFDKETSDQIVALRNDGKKWSEISDAVNLPVGKCMLMFDHASVKAKDVVKNATGAQIAELRDGQSLSWGIISARTRYPESTCRGLYEEHTGKTTKGNRIGKGGRHPNSADTPARVPGARKAAAKATAESTPDPLAGLDKDAVVEKLAGFAIKVAVEGGQPEVIKIKAVKSVTAKTVVLTDSSGAGRTVKRAAILSISSKKVVKS